MVGESGGRGGEWDGVVEQGVGKGREGQGWDTLGSCLHPLRYEIPDKHVLSQSKVNSRVKISMLAISIRHTEPCTMHYHHVKLHKNLTSTCSFRVAGNFLNEKKYDNSFQVRRHVSTLHLSVLL